MRILQVATLVNKDASGGGPIRGTIKQSHELQRRGHSVTLVAGTQDIRRLLQPIELKNHPFQTTLFPAHRVAPGSRFATLVSPGLLFWLTRRGKDFDAALVHSGRDFITMFAAAALLFVKVPVVIQTHGMIIPDNRFFVRLCDRFLTRPVLRRAACVLVLTQQEEDRVRIVTRGKARLVRLPNGVPMSEEPGTAPRQPPVVLFLSRLHGRKRPQEFVRMATLLRSGGLDAQYWIVGPDEGELQPTLRLIADLNLVGEVTYKGAVDYDEVISIMQESSVYVLPSDDEPFPNTVLEALASGLPAVVTETCQIADVLQVHGAASVVPADARSLAEAVLRLLKDPTVRSQQIRQGKALVTSQFSMEHVGNLLEGTLRSAAAGVLHHEQNQDRATT